MMITLTVAYRYNNQARCLSAIASPLSFSKRRQSSSPTSYERATSTKTTGLVWNELFMWHDTGNYAGLIKPDPNTFVQPGLHYENPEPKRRIKNLLDASGTTKHLHEIESRYATCDELLLVHDQDYINTMEDINSKELGVVGEFGYSTVMNKGGFDIARLAAGGCLSLVDAMLQNKVQNGYALCRPPGHHALPDKAMGFCLLNNASLAARYAQQELLKVGPDNRSDRPRIVIIDWDVHHGNGTEFIFYDDPSVLVISIHQDNCFPPESGLMEHIGKGDGEGHNINIPLPPGSGHGAYQYAFDEIVIPSIDRFMEHRDGMIIVESGFDAMGYDPLGRQLLYSGSYAEMTQKLIEAAHRFCHGRLLMTHEGGYNPDTVPFACLKVIETLSGITSKVDDPFEFVISNIGGQELQSHQREAIDQVAKIHFH
mmetsp:Transcript_117/g.307  ORF Transcript_117/g.307 Transcript_117/m.307 type:complete len:427 (-) Transcript_117:42-1322(-)